MRKGRARLLSELLPRLTVTVPDRGVAFDPRTLFDGHAADRRVWLEIGFGGGEHLAAQAAAYPDIGFIGCEPFLNGVGSLLGHIDQQRLGNVRILPDDVMPLLDALPDASIDRLFILFPDPWPKVRHHRRRIVGPATVGRFARVLRPGAICRIATDHQDYLRWILDVMLACPEFRWTARRPGDWRRRPDDWPETRYEAKALAEGRPPAFLEFERVSSKIA